MQDALPTTTLCSSTCDRLFLLRNNKKKTLDKCQVMKTMYIVSCVTQYISVTPIIRQSIAQVRTKLPQERLNHCLHKVCLTVARVTAKCECWIKAAGLAIYVNSKINKDYNLCKKTNMRVLLHKSCCFRFPFFPYVTYPSQARMAENRFVFVCIT